MTTIEKLQRDTEGYAQAVKDGEASVRDFCEAMDNLFNAVKSQPDWHDFNDDNYATN